MKLVEYLNSSHSDSDSQYQALAEKCGVPGNQCPTVFQQIQKIFALKGEKNQKLESLMQQIHFSQLINFDYKFSITTADSMIQSNGKCLVNLKLDLLDENNSRKSVYVELSLGQFY